MPEGAENWWRFAENIYTPVGSKQVVWSGKGLDLYLDSSPFDSSLSSAVQRCI